MTAGSHPHHERLADILLGLSLIGWAIAGCIQDLDHPQAMWPVRICLIAMQTEVGLLIILRERASAFADLKAFAAALPSFVLSGILFKCSLPMESWPPALKWTFAIATIWVMACFIWLGRSFAILPARRALVRKGPYALIRHPAYLGEAIMAITCTLAAGTYWAWGACLFLFPCLALRILTEERLLSHDPQWQAYRDQTPWRLLPGVW